MGDFFHPCVSMSSGIARAKFKVDFDLIVSADLLMRDKEFKEIRHSQRLGLLKTYGNIQVILFGNGEVSAQPFTKQEEAFKYLKELGMKLWDAQICPKSGKAISICDFTECGDECWGKIRSYIPLLYEREDD